MKEPSESSAKSPENMFTVIVVAVMLVVGFLAFWGSYELFQRWLVIRFDEGRPDKALSLGLVLFGVGVLMLFLSSYATISTIRKNRQKGLTSNV